MMALACKAPSDHVAEEAAAFIMSLRARGIRDMNVLRAMERIPRAAFAPRRFHDLARSDMSLPLPCGQTMTAPSLVAAMLIHLDLKPGHHVLEIGTGSGYVTALLAHMGAHVHSVERYTTLLAGAALRLQSFKPSEVSFETGDGLDITQLQSLKEQRFDRILLNGTLASIPASLTSLLTPDGKLVGAIPRDQAPHLIKIERLPDGTLHQSIKEPVRLSSLIAGKAQCL